MTKYNRSLYRKGRQMKLFKKMITFVLVAIMTVAMGATSVSAQTVGDETAGTGKITINNPARGETYKVHKLFDATVDEKGNIAYTATAIPEGLGNFFEIKNGYVYPKDAIATKDEDGKITGTKMTDELKAALENWATDSNKTAEAESDGSELVFRGLPYGYYVMTTTHKSDAAEGQEAKAAISVTSTNPDANIVDKNTTTPTASKSVDDHDVYIGETVTYTLEFATTNWMGQGTGAKQVIKYEIKDTLPNYLSDINVTSIKVDADGNTETTNDQTTLTTTQFANKKIDIAWADEIADSDPTKYQSKYNNGAKIIITYTAKVTAQANVGDADGNRNEVTLTPYVDNGTSSPEPWNETFKDDETIKTYGAAIHKVDDKGNNLKGAKFKIPGLTVTGTKGQYTVSNYDNTITLENSTDENSTEMEVDDEGYIYIPGLASDVTLSVTETVAPKGYNKLTAPETLTPIKMSETTTYSTKTVYYDADGKVVHEETTGGTSKEISANFTDLKKEANVLRIENKKGVELPSTGGIGTTIFYVLGGLLAVGAGIVLVARRKASE